MPEIECRVDPAQFRQLLADLKAFDKSLATATRKRLRGAAEPAIKDMRRRLTSGNYKRNTGMTKALARGIRTKISTSVRSPGVSIVATGRYLPAEKQAMVKAFNKASFRHPTFGNREAWVAQAGRPYFGAVLDWRKRQMQTAMEDALRDAAATIRAGEAA